MISLIKVQRTVAPINLFYILGLLCFLIVQRIVQSVQGDFSFSQNSSIWMKSSVFITVLNFGAVLLTLFILLKENRNPDVSIVFEKPDPIMSTMATMWMINLVLHWKETSKDYCLLFFIISIAVYCAASCFDNEKKNKTIQETMTDH